MSLINTPFDLSGRVAVVTGGGGLLGLQHTLALAEAGAIVVVGDIRFTAAQAVAEQTTAQSGLSAYAIHLDVTTPESIRAALQFCLTQLGRCDILINNAAIDPKVKDDDALLERSRFEHFTLEDWNFQISVGLTGAYLCAQVFGTHLAAQRRGVILNIASDLSVIAPDQRLYRRPDLPDERQPVKPVTYSVIKTGLVGLTRYLAAYWADKGVRVNALSPGGVYTSQPEAFVKRLIQLIPQGRMAQPDEYRGAVQFLCSDASLYLTGQNIVMDGGRSTL
jgi:NAD(P)-dependent dehydrogenase (short-subunit alcohol dehydrogenase family)